MAETKVLEAYSDESGINVGDRYTSISVVSGEADVLDCLRDRLSETLKDKKVKEEVKKLRERFLQMKFCLSPEEALPIASRIIKSIFSYPDFAQKF